MRFSFFKERPADIAEKNKKGVERKSDTPSWKKIEKVLDIEALRGGVRSEFITPEVIRALARLTLEIGDQLKNYDAILSDDASGRLVALFLRRLVDKERRGVKKGPVKTYFVATGRHGLPQVTAAVEGFIRDKSREGVMGKTLVVTEFISSGRSIWRLIEILKKQNIDFDLATVSISLDLNSALYPDELRQEFAKRLYYGVVGEEGERFYGKRTATGVEVGWEGGRRASPHPIRSREASAEAKRVAREDMNFLADECAKLLEK